MFNPILFLACIGISSAANQSRFSPPLAAGTNIAGALIFFIYIVAALVFTALILRNVIRIKHGSTKLKGGGQTSRNKDNGLSVQRNKDRPGEAGMKKELRILFPVAASVSFTALSWNMLNFLIVSYVEWWHKQEISSVGHLTSISGFRQQLWFIWVWATHSSLFQTFAEDLLLSSDTSRSTQLSLLYSYGWNLWMSMNGYEQNVPSLWMYFVLDQILPISFTQNLFCITMALSAKRRIYRRQPFRNLSVMRITAMASYVALLFSIPKAVHTRWFFLNLFALRILLLAPFLIDYFAFKGSEAEQSKSNEGVRMTNKYCLLALALCGAFSIFNGPRVTFTSSAKLNTNYAATALSTDLFIAVVSGLTYAICWTA